MHDANGTELKLGDKVFIPCIVTSVSPGPDFCNVSVQTTLGRRPDGIKENFNAINTAQLVKASGTDNTLGL